MKNLLIKEQRDYSKGLTELEFSLMRAQFVQEMYNGTNGVDCDDCQAADDMIWEIEDIHEDWDEGRDDTEYFYCISGYAVHAGKHSQKPQVTEFYGWFNEEGGLFSHAIVPAGEVENRE